MKIAKVMQITLENGVHIQVGCDGLDKFKIESQRIVSSNTEFVTVIDECIVCKGDISSIEYFERKVDEGRKQDEI